MPGHRADKENPGEDTHGMDMGIYATHCECHYSRLLSFAYSRIGNIDDAEDVTQKAMLNGLRKLGTFRGHPSSKRVYSWLAGIVQNTAIDHHRAQQRRPEVAASTIWTEDSVVHNPQNHLEQIESRATLSVWLGKLTTKQRQALLLTYVEELSAAEIAQEIGTSLSNVSTLVWKAKNNVRGQAARDDAEFGEVHGIEDEQVI